MYFSLEMQAAEIYTNALGAVEFLGPQGQPEKTKVISLAKIWN